MNTSFIALPIGACFICNGNECLKKSTRTALLVAYDKIFYFAANDRVQILGLK